MLPEPRTISFLRYLYWYRIQAVAILIISGALMFHALPKGAPADLVTPPALICSHALQSGETLRSTVTGNGPNTLTIDNGTADDAIVTVRDFGTGRLAVSFFVAANTKTTYQGIPNGAYKTQFAMGQNVAQDCHSFVRTKEAAEFNNVEAMDYTKVEATLQPVPQGNATTHAISVEQFNAE